MKLGDRGIGIVHRNRSETFEALRMFRDQLGVSVVQDSCDFRLASFVGEKNVRSGKRNNLDVYSNTIHVFETLVDVGHRRRDSKEPGSVESDDCAAGWIFGE